MLTSRALLRSTHVEATLNHPFPARCRASSDLRTTRTTDLSRGLLWRPFFFFGLSR